MPNYICVTCGMQYMESVEPPLNCLICEEERGFVSHNGQHWTTPDDLKRDHHNVVRSLEPGLSEIFTQPKFGIGQRALLVETPAGNVLWDCLSLIDDATVVTIDSLGGISSLAMSHPHMYGNMVEWSRAFGNVPILLHASDESWITRPDPAIEFWDGETHQLSEGVTLYHCGGHYSGSAVLHWSDGAEGLGVLLSSDTLLVAPNRKQVTFMYSYPNFIPLSGPVVDRIVEKLESINFDRIYSHIGGLELRSDAKATVKRSAERYKKAIG